MRRDIHTTRTLLIIDMLLVIFSLTFMLVPIANAGCCTPVTAVGCTIAASDTCGSTGTFDSRECSVIPVCATNEAGVSTPETAISGQGLRGSFNLFDQFTRPGTGFKAGGEPEVVAGNIIKGLMALIGVIFGILIIYGGFLWMIARGNEENVKKSIDIIQAAVIGFIVTVAAYAITNYVISQIISAAFQ